MSYFEDVQRWDQATLDRYSSLELRVKVMEEELEELAVALEMGSMAAIAKEAADVVWTVLGLCNGLGVPFDAVWEEVRRSNFTKVSPDGAVLRREDGKILKPPGWTPPDIETVMDRERLR